MYIIKFGLIPCALGTEIANSGNFFITMLQEDLKEDYPKTK
jgi:hypothetical protein